LNKQAPNGQFLSITISALKAMKLNNANVNSLPSNAAPPNSAST
jgi:hypothetical protein